MEEMRSSVHAQATGGTRLRNTTPDLAELGDSDVDLVLITFFYLT